MAFLSTFATPFKKAASIFSGCFAIDALMESHPSGTMNNFEPSEKTPALAVIE